MDDGELILLKEKVKIVDEQSLLDCLRFLAAQPYNYRDESSIQSIHQLASERSLEKIDLFLAENISNTDVLESLYKKYHKRNRAIFLAVLSNQKMFKDACGVSEIEDCWINFNDLFCTDKSASIVLLYNKSIGLLCFLDKIVEFLVQKYSKSLAEFPDNKDTNNPSSPYYWRDLLYALVDNKSDGTYFSDQCSYSGSGGLEAIWGLLFLLPICSCSRRIFFRIVLSSIPFGHEYNFYKNKPRKLSFDRALSQENLNKLFCRLSGDTENQDREGDQYSFFSLRACLAQAIVLNQLNHSSSELDEYFMNHEDLAVRIGYYRSFGFCFSFNKKEEDEIYLLKLFQKFYHRDNIHFLQAIIDGKNNVIFKSIPVFKKYSKFRGSIKDLKVKRSKLAYSFSISDYSSSNQDNECELFDIDFGDSGYEWFSENSEALYDDKTPEDKLLYRKLSDDNKAIILQIKKQIFIEIDKRINDLGRLIRFVLIACIFTYLVSRFVLWFYHLFF